jgi:hypothetical protein
MKKIPEFQRLASKMVGDGKTPNTFFVTREGVTELITTHFPTAYRYWLRLPREVETALEDRLCGCLGTNEPEEDGSKKLVFSDDTEWLRSKKHAIK